MEFKCDLTFSSKYYSKVFDILPKFSSRLVGGCVRDALLCKVNLDIDIVTKLRPQQVTELLLSHNVRVIPTGIRFGGVTALYENEKFEITTIRKDINPSGRYTDVEFCDNFQEDAIRRDFTINALSYCPEEKLLYDYCGGINDLKNKIVRFIGLADKRIEEDYLRILRFFRFSAYYADEIDRDGTKAATEYKDHLVKISKERLRSELDKIIMSPRAVDILKLMNECRIISIIFMNIDINYLSKSLSLYRNLSKDFRYALLIVNNDNTSIESLLALKFTKQEAISIIKKIELINNFDFSKIDYNLECLWLENDNFNEFIIALIVTNKISKTIGIEFIDTHLLIDKPKFEIDGKDLLNMGYKGEVLGQKLAHLKERWIMSKYKLDKSALLKLCQ